MVFSIFTKVVQPSLQYNFKRFSLTKKKLCIHFSDLSLWSKVDFLQVDVRQPRSCIVTGLELLLGFRGTDI